MIKTAPIEIDERTDFKIADKRIIALRQSDEAGRVFCSCGCGLHMANLGATKTGLITINKIPGIGSDWEHDTARTLGGKTDAENGRLMARACHKAKKTPSDIQAVSRAKRRSGETGQYRRRQERKAAGKRPLIQGPKFQTRLRKRMNGTVEVRA